MNFKQFADVVHNTHIRLAGDDNAKAFWTSIDNEIIYEEYLKAYPIEFNGIFRERSVHDCNSCKSYIKRVGSIVFLIDGVKHTVWDDAALDESLNEYNIVAKRMRELLLSNKIASYALYSSKLDLRDVAYNVDNYDDTIIWHHLNGEIPQRLLKEDAAKEIGLSIINKNVFQDSLYKITPEAIQTVIDLIESDSIYRGEEHLRFVISFQKIREEFFKTDLDPEVLDTHLWHLCSIHNPSITGIKNRVIGTLLLDLSEGVDLEVAVRSFESKVAPQNYKRSKSIITQSMIDAALKTVDELGYRGALKRRHAKLSDITINNVIYADANAKSVMKETDELQSLLSAEVSKTKKSKTGAEIDIADFINTVIPTASKIEAMVENNHESSFVSLIAPVEQNVKNILKWSNDFSWSYNGNLADSDIKQRVKSAGGAIDKDLRISLSWFNTDDLDIHCKTPQKQHIYHGNKLGILDVDMNVHGESTEPVENLAWNLDQIQPGEHSISVRNYRRRNSTQIGFTIEIEFLGDIYTYQYNKSVSEDAEVHVLNFSVVDGKLNLNVSGVMKEDGSSVKSKNIWNVNTNTYVTVNSIMYSPNHWDENSIGNKHYFFMLDGCAAETTLRGLYNEMISNDLNNHRKVFEILGDKLKCEKVNANEQLSGLGFSSTLRKSLTVKVTGADKSVKQYIIKF